MRHPILKKNKQSLNTLINKFYIKYYMIKSGNDSAKLKKELSDISKELSEDLIKKLKLN
jgi:gas vesicle protein